MSEGRYSVSYSALALDDLRAIYTYIAFELQEKGPAGRQIKRIQEEVRALAHLPKRYALVEWEPWNQMGVRKLPVNKYVIYYQVNRIANTVEIIRIFYGGRDIERIISEGIE